MPVVVITPREKIVYTSSVLVVSRLDAKLDDIATLYDKRGGVPESFSGRIIKGFSSQSSTKGGHCSTLNIYKIRILLDKIQVSNILCLVL